jgi:diacylglycerol O-acyltransferase
MLTLYPYVPIADRIRIGVAVTSYARRLHFGITCDRDSMPDADVLTAAIGSALAELVDLSSVGQTRVGSRPTGFAN